jgi:magnesium chelatase family protein
MLFKARSAAVYGIDANIIDVEVDFSGVVWRRTLPHRRPARRRRAREPRPRPRRHQELRLRHSAHRITINLAPADIKKEGSGFDLPIAIGILGAYGGLHIKDISNFLLVGELGLDGSCAPCRACCPSPSPPARKRHQEPVIPAANAREAAVVEGVNVYPVHSLLDVRELLNSAVARRHHASRSRIEAASLLDELQHFPSTSKTCAASTSPSALWKSPPPVATTSS